MKTADRVLAILSRVAENTEVHTNLELPLYEAQLLDSLQTVELIVELSEEFDIEISPAEFERANWATPQKIIGDIEHRIAK